MELAAIILAIWMAATPVVAHSVKFAGGENAITLNFRDGTCSGTRVGLHTILTATHCFASGQALIGIDESPATATGLRVDDGSDHTLATVSATFTTWARFGASPVAGDAVHIWGSPGGLHHMLRVGVVSGWQEGRCVIDINSWFGDSGAGLLDADGRVVGVLSSILSESRPLTSDVAQWKMTVMLPLAFTPAQIKAIK